MSTGGVSPAVSDQQSQAISVDEAIEIVAQHIAAEAVRNHPEWPEWAAYPDLGEDDWLKVIDRIDSLNPYPERYCEAYELLAERASGSPS